jgi:hypothetical protein
VNAPAAARTVAALIFPAARTIDVASAATAIDVALISPAATRGASA